MAADTTNPFLDINKAINSSLDILNKNNKAFENNQTTIIQNFLQIRNSSKSAENYIEALVRNTNDIEARLELQNKTFTSQIKILNDQVTFLSNVVLSLTNSTSSSMSFLANDIHYAHTSVQVMGANFLALNLTTIT